MSSNQINPDNPGNGAHKPDYEVKAGLDRLAAFDVVGVSVRTDNSKGAEDINALWERFFEANIGQSLENKINDVIYAVYSDYEGDHEKPYRFTIGYRVDGTDTPPPEGMHHVHLPEQDYAILSAAGSQPQALIETWQAIWQGDLDRTYKADFEVYGPRFFKEGVHEVLIHIGVK